MSKVHNLPNSDYIIALGPGGRVSEQGTYEEVAATCDRFQGLQTYERDRDDDPPRGDKADTAAAASRAELVEEEMQQAIDISVWRHYASALGWEKMALLVVFLVMESSFGAFRCTLPFNPCRPSHVTLSDG